MGVDHRKGPGSCALRKYVSDHHYWGLICPREHDLLYILITDLLLRVGHSSAPKIFRRELNKRCD